MRSPHDTKQTAWNMWERVSEEGWTWSLILAGPSCCKEVKRENVRSVMLAGFVLLLASGDARRGQEMVSIAFYIALGRWPRQNGISHSHWVKICDNHNGQINLRAKQKYEVFSATKFFKVKIHQASTCIQRIFNFLYRYFLFFFPFFFSYTNSISYFIYLFFNFFVICFLYLQGVPELPLVFEFDQPKIVINVTNQIFLEAPQDEIEDYLEEEEEEEEEVEEAEGGEEKAQKDKDLKEQLPDSKAKSDS